MQRDPFRNLLGQLVSNPYPVYHTVRRLDPVHYSPGWDAWFLTRHEDVEKVMRDARFSVGRVGDFSQRLSEPYPMERIERALGSWLLFTDPPRHGRLRALISRAFTPRTLQRFEQSVRDRVQGLVDRFRPEQTVDLISELASPLPVMTIADILGGRPQDLALFQDWSHQLATFLGSDELTAEVASRAEASLDGLEGYFRDLLEERERAPQDDLVSSLLAARDDEGRDRLTREEVLSLCTLLFAAGHDTTTNLLGNGFLALIQHPLEKRKVAQGQVSVETAVEEILRFDSPSQIASRHVLQDVELGGKRLRPGELVNLCMGAANRDPAVFPEPDRFDVSRPGLAKHLAFGRGIHTCVGAHLARLEARITFETVLGRWPRLALEGPVERYPTLGFRRLKSLPVRLEAP
ncbi:MAG: cytochrome P450 [Candidatus Eremiobacterota bacterium]